MSSSAQNRRGLTALALAAVLLVTPGVATAETIGSDVTLTVEVYRNPGGMEVAFNRDLDQARVLALRFAVANGSERELIVRRTDMTLKLGDGRQVGSISAKQAALRADAGPNVAGVIAGAFFLGYTGAAIASNAAEQARRNQISSYDAREFKDIALAPEESSQGYVFFHLPGGIAGAQNGELLVRLVDSDSGALAIAAVPLKDVGGAPVETPKPESRLIRESGRDIANQGTSAPPEPQIEVIGAASTVSVPAPDPVADQPVAAPAPENVAPMTGTALTAPAYVEPEEEEIDELEGSTEPLGGPAGRP